VVHFYWRTDSASETADYKVQFVNTALAQKCSSKSNRNLKTHTRIFWQRVKLKGHRRAGHFRSRKYNVDADRWSITLQEEDV